MREKTNHQQQQSFRRKTKTHFPPSEPISIEIITSTATNNKRGTRITTTETTTCDIFNKSSESVYLAYLVYIYVICNNLQNNSKEIYIHMYNFCQFFFFCGE
ncbi:unnamed protein product [Ceratitis capitata]|uniref:(Mediterranean fruit fly) hypothetical protein n=1 Tax=Ceratitis capitata TaxID=7213 RepID=A0A811VAH4_CERCA|nr:unnamed protein product [Ceratitis capitata]